MGLRPKSSADVCCLLITTGQHAGECSYQVADETEPKKHEQPRAELAKPSMTNTPHALSRSSNAVLLRNVSSP